MIAGLQKMTLLDYPGKVACTVFLRGCNFRCPFCHNSALIPFEGESLMDEEALLAFLRKRQGLLDAVCVSGGEPTLQPRLEPLLRKIRDLGFAVKLDTNGSRPDVLKRLVNEGLVDYVAMDIKNSPSAYGDTTGCPGISLDRIADSIRFLLSGTVDYELRTTVVEELHSREQILQMGQWLFSLSQPGKAKNFFLQSFVDRDSVLLTGLHAPLPRTLEEYVNLLSPYVEKISLRGI